MPTREEKKSRPKSHKCTLIHTPLAPQSENLAPWSKQKAGCTPLVTPTKSQRPAMQTKFATELLGMAVIATGKGEGPR